jgi:hypothetical protein
MKFGVSARSLNYGLRPRGAANLLSGGSLPGFAT